MSKIRRVVYTDDAIADLLDICNYIAEHASATRALRYIDRLQRWIGKLERFPVRGVLRGDIRKDLRVAGFERRVSIAFIVEQDEVVVLRVLYAGRDVESAF